MAAASFVQTAFIGGEWSKRAQGRTDDPFYKVALNVCYNGLPIETGAWVRRPGVRLTQFTKGGQKGRMFSFDFRKTKSYNVELTDVVMRFHSGPHHAYTNDPQVVSSISTATPAIVTVATDHGWVSDNHVIFTDLRERYPHLHNRVFKIAEDTTTTFALYDGITGDAIDGNDIAWASSPFPVNVKRILEIETPWPEGSFETVRKVQTDEGAVFLHEDFSPQLLNVTQQPTDTEDAEFELAGAKFIDGPYFDPPTNGAQLVPSALDGAVQVTLAFEAWSALKTYDEDDFVTHGGVNYQSLISSNVNNNPATAGSSAWTATTPANALPGSRGFTIADVGRHIRMHSEPLDWVAARSYPAKSFVKHNDVYWIALVAIAANAPPPGAVLSAWALAPSAARWTWGKISRLLNTIDQDEAGDPFDVDTTDVAATLPNALFDSLFAKSVANCAKIITSEASVSGRLVSGLAHGALGKNFTTPQRIESVTIYPPANRAYGSFAATTQTVYGLQYNSAGDFFYTPDPTTIAAKVSYTITATLRGKASLPSTPSDGTKLGFARISTGDRRPVIIQNTADTTTAWAYVWVEISVNLVFARGNSGVYTLTSGNVAFSQFQFSAPPATTTSGTNTIVVEIRGDPLLYTTAVRRWRMGVYSDATGWPSCGTYHDGRLWLAGVNGNRFDASVSNQPFNFAPTEPTGVVTDRNAITYTLNAASSNPVLWMRTDDQGVLMGTKASEWLVRSGTGGAITPTNVKAVELSRFGSNAVDPVDAGQSLVFVQRYGKKVRELFPDTNSGRPSSTNLSAKSEHLARSGIIELAYQSEVSPVVWMLRSDGILLGTTYKRDIMSVAQPPNMNGWHHHNFGFDYTIESICVGPSVDGDRDALSLVFKRYSTELHHVGILTDIPAEDASTDESWHMDHSMRPTELVVTGSGIQCLGLWPLEGEEVNVFAGGLSCGTATVEDGQITIAFTSSHVLLNRAYYDSFDGDFKVLVGFNYESKGQLLRPGTAQEAGTRQGPPLAKIRRAQKGAVQALNAQGVQFGTSFDDGRLNKAYFLSAGGGLRLKDHELFSGVHESILQDNYSFDAMLCWRVTGPYPCDIMAIGGALSTQG